MRTRAAASLALALAATLVVGAPAFAQPDDDSDLDQTIEEGQPIVEGEATLDAGHVDMGPRYVDGEWTLLVHDDAARADAGAQSVWRFPDSTVFHVVDAAAQAVPDDPAYEFLGAAPGEEVYVVPQTQNPDVVWLGWNTQDPEVMATIDRGVTLSLTGVEGPGTVSVFLQSGSFGDPEPLWDSRVTESQPLWVDVNTHTHANWVFTEPGVYLLQLVIEADLVDGSTVSDTQVLRFAVGDETAPEDALAATWSGGEPAGNDPDAGDEAPAETAAAADPLVPILIGAIVVAALLAAVFIVLAVRGGRAKREGLSAGSGE